MDTTSASLLIRVRDRDNSDAWAHFADLYTPLIFFWARRIGLNSNDAADLVQDVFSTLVKVLPEFDYNVNQSFRSWLRTVTLNKWREYGRKHSLKFVEASPSELANIVEPAESIQFWENDYHRQLFARAMELSRSQFEPRTWDALQEYLKKGKGAAEIAKKYQLSMWTIYAAKTRLMKSLRQELDGMIE